MKKLPKLYWIISAVITIAGMSVMTVGAIQSKQENQKSQPIEIPSLCKGEELENIIINIGSADVIIEASPDDTVSLKLSNDRQFEYQLENQTLEIRNKKNSLFWDIQFIDIGIIQNENQIILSLPEKEYKELKLSSGAGDMNFSDVDAETLNASAGAGNIDLNKTEIKSDFAIDLGSGNFTAEDCQFSGIRIQNGAGETNMQNVTLAGNAEIKCGAGNITMMLSGNVQDYQIDCSEVVGEVTIQNHNLKNTGSESAQYQIKANTVGNAEFTFTE
ncbi:MAG: DUF4097 family beta strand repeat protein [Oscillospiraceae bacterium]|nr:DUF4097 family beta strand repeat protein [Oscillospiraceae bacterium]